MVKTLKPITIIIPSDQEAECLEKVLPEILTITRNNNYSTTILIVNDLGEKDQSLEKLCTRHNVVLINTPYNMGSQEAIIYGIRQQVKNYRSDIIVTMDADGQDDLNAIPHLLNEVKPNTITVAQRTGKRPEGARFKCLYFLYKKIFSFLTKITPDFGNFAAFDQSIADQIARSPHFNITYSMALPLVSKIKRIPVERLNRLNGKSRIGFQGLIDHAICSTLPYLNVIAMRIAILSLVPALLGFVLVAITSFLRIFMLEYTFTNWATTIASGVTIIALQLFTICLILFLSASLYRQFVSSKSRCNVDYQVW